MSVFEQMMGPVGRRINEEEKEQGGEGQRAESNLPQMLFDCFHFGLPIIANIAKGPRLVNPVTKLGISRSWKDQVHMVRVNEVAPFQIIALAFALCVLASCGRNERMDTVYAQRCLGCHGAVGKGDGPISPSLPVGIPDFRDTVQRKNVLQIRRAISDGRGMMPAFEPALSGAEIQDMVIMVRLLSREDRNLQWWEKFDSLVWAHCSVPWDYVLGYDEPPEQKSP